MKLHEDKTAFVNIIEKIHKQTNKREDVLGPGLSGGHWLVDFPAVGGFRAQQSQPTRGRL